MNFVTIMTPASVNINEASSTDGGVGGEDPTVVNNGKTSQSNAGNDSGIDIGGTPGTTEPETTPAQEPAEPTIINYSAGAAKAGTEPFVGGESLSTQGADYPATVQGNAGTTNAGGETIRK